MSSTLSNFQDKLFDRNKNIALTTEGIDTNSTNIRWTLNKKKKVLLWPVLHFFICGGYVKQDIFQLQFK